MSHDICLSFSDWLSMRISRSSHVAENGIVSFFLLPSVVYMYLIFFTVPLLTDTQVVSMFWL